MRIVSAKQISFLISNIFENYYEPIQKELSHSGLRDEVTHKIEQEILAIIYRRAMDEGIETKEELDNMAVAIINERLERVLVPHYAQKYVDKFSLDKVDLENGMLNRIREKQSEQELQESVAHSIEALEKSEETDSEEKQFLCDDLDDDFDDDFEDVEIMDWSSEQSEPLIVRRMEEPRIRTSRVNWTLTIVASLLVSLILWFTVGLFMGRGYIPRVDLGYTWFNSHIWRVF